MNEQIKEIVEDIFKFKVFNYQLKLLEKLMENGKIEIFPFKFIDGSEMKEIELKSEKEVTFLKKKRIQGIYKNDDKVMVNYYV